MQNNIKRFLLLNSLILAQVCFLTANITKSPTVVSTEKEVYSQKINTLPLSQTSENAPEVPQDSSFFLFLLFATLSIHTLIKNFQQKKWVDSLFYQHKFFKILFYYHKSQNRSILKIQQLINYFINSLWMCFHCRFFKSYYSTPLPH